MKLHTGIKLSLDDVLLVPQYSTIKSRLDTDLSTRLTKDICIDIPIISANMDTITELEMSSKMGELGGCGFLHRFASDEKIIGWVKELVYKKQLAIPSIGIREDVGIFVGVLLGAGADAINVDVAHAHTEMVLRIIDLLVDLYPGIQIIGGNAATAAGTKALINSGVSAVKVNIGPGSQCKTRVVTGFGVPTFSAIFDCVQEANKYDVPVIADGGLKSSGDFVKCLAIGAESCMTGSMLAGTEETPGNIIKVGDNLYKEYRGMASEAAQRAFRGGLKEGTAAEGEATTIKFRGPVEPIVGDITGGIRSGLTYCGARNFRELRDKAEFIGITNSSIVEGLPHGLNK